MCNSGAERLLHQHMVGFGMADDIHQDFIVSHVWSRYNHYITHATIQQLLVTTKYLQIFTQITINTHQSTQSNNLATNLQNPFSNHELNDDVRHLYFPKPIE